MALIHVIQRSAFKVFSEKKTLPRKLVQHKKVGDVVEELIPNLKVRGVLSSHCTLKNVTFQDSERKKLSLSQSLEQQGRSDCHEFYLIDHSSFNLRIQLLIASAILLSLLIGILLYALFFRSYPLMVVYPSQNPEDSCAIFVRHGSSMKSRRFVNQWVFEDIRPRSIFFDRQIEVNLYPAFAPIKEHWKITLTRNDHLKNGHWVVNLADSSTTPSRINCLVVGQKTSPVLQNLNAPLSINSFRVPNSYKITTEDIYYRLSLPTGVYAMNFSGPRVQSLKLTSVEPRFNQKTEFLDSSFATVKISNENEVVKFSYDE